MCIGRGRDPAQRAWSRDRVWRSGVHGREFARGLCSVGAGGRDRWTVDSPDLSGEVEILLNAHGVEIESGGQGYTVESSLGAFAASALVVATGGLSIPKVDRAR